MKDFTQQAIKDQLTSAAQRQQDLHQHNCGLDAPLNRQPSPQRSKAGEWFFSCIEPTCHRTLFEIHGGRNRGTAAEKSCAGTFIKMATMVLLLLSFSLPAHAWPHSSGGQHGWKPRSVHAPRPHTPRPHVPRPPRPRHPR